MAHSYDRRDAHPPGLGGASSLLVAFVEDVDEHCARAQAAGATILMEPEDRPWGLRQYIAQDLDGHRWEFSQFLRHVPPQEWGATLAEPG
jgi:uncharacterized glyoxalase superfamily protein PhnB